MIAKGQITIVDLNDGKSLSLYLGSNKPSTQVYDPNATTSHYTPDFSTSNLVITPEMFISGSTSAVTSIKDVVWKINGGDGIIKGGTNADFGASVGATYPYALTINKNLTSVNQLLIECSATYHDEETLSDTVAKASISFTKVDNAGNACVAVMYAPGGNVISSTVGQEVNEVKLHCDLWRGSTIDNTNVSYQWSKLTDGSYQNLTNGTNYSGVTSNELTVKADGVDNFEIFRCVITDTDSGSLTYNKTFVASMVVNDVTDPYTVEISSPSGNVLTKGMTSTTLQADIWQNGQICGDALHANASYAWTKYDMNGENGVSAGTTRTITVTRDSVSVRATYVCQVSI